MKVGNKHIKPPAPTPVAVWSKFLRMRHCTIESGGRRRAPVCGADVEQNGLFSYVSIEDPVPAQHPLR